MYNHDCVHVQVKVVEFGAVWVGTCDINGNGNIFAVLSSDLGFLLFDNLVDCISCQYNHRLLEGNSARTDLRVFFAQPAEQSGYTLQKA
jgi:hypothetical protein